MIDHSEIHILPLLNPEGSMLSKQGDCDGKTGSLNGNDVDLDTNFPGNYSSHSEYKPVLICSCECARLSQYIFHHRIIAEFVNICVEFEIFFSEYSNTFGRHVNFM